MGVLLEAFVSARRSIPDPAGKWISAGHTESGDQVPNLRTALMELFYQSGQSRSVIATPFFWNAGGTVPDFSDIHVFRRG
jgi:hypothetical protein